MVKRGSRSSESSVAGALVYAAHSSFYIHFMHVLSKLKASQKIALLGFASVLLVLCVWFANSSTTRPVLNSISQTTASQSAHHLNNSQLMPPGQANPAQTPGSNGSATGSSANVTVNGQSVSADTNSQNPNTSISKTIETGNGSTNVSIQSSSSGTAGNSDNSFQNVYVNSSSSGSSDTSIDFSQQSSGGSTQ